jgi:hypothetical protein
MYTLEDRKITFDVPVEAAPGVINNSRDHFEFTFNQTFDTGTKQDAVFDAVARPIIDGALEGFNGTVFAYGQTGSGKTFTMTGGQSSFNDRGIIPRTLQCVSCPQHAHSSLAPIKWRQQVLVPGVQEAYRLQPPSAYQLHGDLQRARASCIAPFPHTNNVTITAGTTCWPRISKAATT